MSLSTTDFPLPRRAEEDVRASLRDGKTDIAKDDVVVEGERYLVEHDGGRDGVPIRHPRARWSRPVFHMCFGILRSDVGHPPSA
jgi:hypothetical protein